MYHGTGPKTLLHKPQISSPLANVTFFNNKGEQLSFLKLTVSQGRPSENLPWLHYGLHLTCSCHVYFIIIIYGNPWSVLKKRLYLQNHHRQRYRSGCNRKLPWPGRQEGDAGHCIRQRHVHECTFTRCLCVDHQQPIGDC